MAIIRVVLVLTAVFYLADCIKIDGALDFGGDAQENEFPFMVQLQRYLVVSYVQECGGSLLTAAWILTAAHCSWKQTNLQALAGTVKRNDRINGQRRAVVRFVTHERYVLDGSVGPYDIGLALVEKPFVLDGVSMATIQLSRIEAPEFFIVMGYGKIDNDDTMADVLQTVVVHQSAPEMCGKLPPPIGTLCVGSPGATACQGDSGGPVVARGHDGILRQVGVVSYGSRTCGAKPIICTDVAAYEDWINGTLKAAAVEDVY